MLGPLYAHREAYIILFESQDATSVGGNQLSRGFLQEMTTSSSSLVPPGIVFGVTKAAFGVTKAAVRGCMSGMFKPSFLGYSAL